MAWNNGGPSPWGNPRPGGQPPQGGPGGPWGNPPPGGGGGGPGRGPDIEDMIRQAQDTIRRWLPRGGAGGRGTVLLVVLVAAVVLAYASTFRVQQDELGIVMRFGAYHRQAPPGLNFAIPWPVETVTTPRVTRINRVDVGFRAAPDSAPNVRPIAQRDVLPESLMLTGDENIIDIDFAVFWRIRSASEFLFNTRSPEETVKSAAESVMRQIIGRTPIQAALTDARSQIELDVRTGTQAILNEYGAGIEITQVQMQKVDPPSAVIESFRDVQRANADRERVRNEAESFRNDIIPRARGEAERMLAEAQGFRDSQTARARGEAGRFTSVLTAYTLAQDVTMRRIYLETMEDILRRNPMVLVDDRLQGVVPYLQLGEGQQGRPRPAPAPPQVTNPAPQPAPRGAVR
jgi:modulator of FtsH protease HflK